MGLTPNLLLVAVIIFVAGLAIFVALVRLATRANEQITLLEALNEKQRAQIALLMSMSNGGGGKISLDETPATATDRRNPELIWVAGASVVIFVVALIFMNVQ